MPHPTPVQAGDDGSLVALEIDGERLVIERQEIESIEAASGLIGKEQLPVDEGTPVVGHLAFAGAHWPVVCVGSDLTPQARIPVSRNICLLLRSPERGFGVLCDGIRLLNAQDLSLRRLPACMAVVPASPFSGLAIHAGKVVGVIAVNTLGGFLEWWVSQGRDSSQSWP